MSKKLDPKAAKEADAAFYKDHPEMAGKKIDPTDPKQKDYPREWWKHYKEAKAKGKGAPKKPNDTGQPCSSKCKAVINKPLGSLDASTNPQASWKSTPCYHFDFQGVISGSKGPYVLDFNGQITPSGKFSYKWTLDAAAGTLTNDTTSSPTHTAPASPGEGYIKLEGINDKDKICCSDKKKVKIYKDHLGRDYENFGTGTSCKGPTWKFTRFGTTITMKNRWNCHGGTLHAYDGRGSGSAGPSAIDSLLPKAKRSTKLKKTVTVTHTSDGKGTHPPLGSLDRGDIIAYYTASGDLAHTQTCTGNGTDTYGANNIPVKFPGRPFIDEAWKWAISAAGDWANKIKKDLFPGATPFTIKVFQKP